MLQRVPTLLLQDLAGTIRFLSILRVSVDLRLLPISDVDGGELARRVIAFAVLQGAMGLRDCGSEPIFAEQIMACATQLAVSKHAGSELIS